MGRGAIAISDGVVRCCERKSDFTLEPLLKTSGKRVASSGAASGPSRGSV